MENLWIADYRKDLEQSILCGNKAEILQLLERTNINVNKFVNNDGDTVLHLALQNYLSPTNEVIEILDILINRGADPNIKNKKHETALHTAIDKWDKEIIQYLLEHNTSIDVTDDLGHSIVHFVVKKMLEKFISGPHFGDNSPQVKIDLERKCVDFVEWLLMEKGLDFDRKSKNGRSALHLAIEYNLQPILPVLLRSTNDINFVNDCNKQTLLQLFLMASNVEKNQDRLVSYNWVYQTLQSQKYEFSGKIKIPSSLFSRRYDIEIVRILLDRGVSVDHVDKQGQTTLYQAVSAGRHMEIIKMLLARVTLHQDVGISLVSIAVMNSHDDYYHNILATMITKGIDVKRKNKNGETPLYLAVEHKNLRAIDLLVKNGVDFNLNTNDGNNLFHALAQSKVNDKKMDVDYEVEEICKLLVDKGCDVNARNSRGETPLYSAVVNNNLYVGKKLIELGAEVNCHEEVKDWTPLHFAATSEKSIDLINLLLDNGANINCKSRLHGRPLHLAATFDMTEDKSILENVLALLLSRGAEVNARDPRGNSALVRALQVGSVVNVEELLAYGADINDDCVSQALRHCSNDAAKYVIRHWIKLKVANLSPSKRYESYEMQIDGRVYLAIVKEVEKLKSCNIDSQTSLYQWLQMDPYQRYLHIHNEKLRALIGSTTFSEQFPQYSIAILGCYRETARRKALYEAAKEAWLRLIKIDLPHICLEHIFAHLNTGYLYEFIEFADEDKEKSLRQQ